MDRKEFVEETIIGFEEEIFQLLNKILMGEYLTFSVIKDKDISKELLAEKACDYFEKVELETGKAFDKQIQAYMNNWESIVEGFIAETPKPKKKDNNPVVVPRTRQYFEKAISIKESRAISLQKLIDYSRIMICLYVAILEKHHKTIDNFNYSADCLDLDRIITAMKREKNPKPIRIAQKLMFDTAELYCMDTCTFVITIIVLLTIANERL